METTAVGAADGGKKEDVKFNPVEVAASVEASMSESKKPEEEKEKPAEQQSVDEKPVEQKPLEEKPVEEQPTEQKPSEEKTVEEKPVEEKPVEEKVVEVKPVEEKPVEQKPVEQKPVEVKPVEEKPVEVKATEAKPPVPKTVEVEEDEDFSDPDEDDLDDLDDMLDEFSTVRLDSKKPEQICSGKPAPQPVSAPAPAPAAVASSSTAKGPSLEDAFSEEEFAKQLQAGMADLLGELEKSPDMQKQFEDVFKQISAAAAEEEVAESSTKTKSAAKPAPKPTTTATDAPSPEAPSADANIDASFQDTIRRTMERMQASGEQATAAAASGGTDDFMSEMLKQMSSGDLGGDGSEEEFSKMLMSMMEQLTNKEILYEPMKELDDKFPDWLAKNREKTPKDDLKRYEEQQVFVREIVAKFEQKTYSDSNSADREFIVDKMQKMQAAGSPPPDLVGDMASAQDVFNAPDESCNPQ